MVCVLLLHCTALHLYSTAYVSIAYMHSEGWYWFQHDNNRYMTAASSEPAETNAGGMDGTCLVEASF